jgi:ABC-type transport system substrate-binding protein
VATLATVTGQYQAAMLVGFSDVIPDAYAPLLSGSRSEQPAITANITRYVNPAVTRAFADSRTTTDVARQLDDYGIVQEQLSVDTPYLFLVQMRQVVVTSTKVRDLTQWQTGSGTAGLGQDASTVSLAQVWIAP